MSKDQDRTIYCRPDGQWVNKRNDAGRASSLHGTQREAIDAARDMLQNLGSGELTTKGTALSGAKIPLLPATIPTRRRTRSTNASALPQALPAWN